MDIHISAKLGSYALLSEARDEEAQREEDGHEFAQPRHGESGQRDEHQDDDKVKEILRQTTPVHCPV